MSDTDELLSSIEEVVESDGADAAVRASDATRQTGGGAARNVGPNDSGQRGDTFDPNPDKSDDFSVNDADVRGGLDQKDKEQMRDFLNKLQKGESVVRAAANLDMEVDEAFDLYNDLMDEGVVNADGSVSESFDDQYERFIQEGQMEPSDEQVIDESAAPGISSRIQGDDRGGIVVESADGQKFRLTLESGTWGGVLNGAEARAQLQGLGVEESDDSSPEQSMEMDGEEDDQPVEEELASMLDEMEDDEDDHEVEESNGNDLVDRYLVDEDQTPEDPDLDQHPEPGQGGGGDEMIQGDEMTRYVGLTPGEQATSYAQAVREALETFLDGMNPSGIGINFSTVSGDAQQATVQGQTTHQNAADRKNVEMRVDMSGQHNILRVEIPEMDGMIEMRLPDEQPLRNLSLLLQRANNLILQPTYRYSEFGEPESSFQGFQDRGARPDVENAGNGVSNAGQPQGSDPGTVDAPNNSHTT